MDERRESPTRDDVDTLPGVEECRWLTKKRRKSPPHPPEMRAAGDVASGVACDVERVTAADGGETGAGQTGVEEQRREVRSDGAGRGRIEGPPNRDATSSGLRDLFVGLSNRPHAVGRRAEAPSGSRGSNLPEKRKRKRRAGAGSTAPPERPTDADIKGTSDEWGHSIEVEDIDDDEDYRNYDDVDRTESRKCGGIKRGRGRKEKERDEDKNEDEDEEEKEKEEKEKEKEEEKEEAKEQKEGPGIVERHLNAGLDRNPYAEDFCAGSPIASCLGGTMEPPRRRARRASEDAGAQVVRTENRQGGTPSGPQGRTERTLKRKRDAGDGTEGRKEKPKNSHARPIFRGERGSGTIVTPRDEEEFLASLVLTEEEYLRASRCKQRTPDWYKYRMDRLSASNYGRAAMHHDPRYHPDVKDLLFDMMWPELSQERRDDRAKAYMGFGAVMEKHGMKLARMLIVEHYQAMGYETVWIEDTGTMICREHPWLSVSSDGLIYGTAPEGSELPPLRGTVEHKDRPFERPYPVAPHYYYDQFMGAAALLGVEHIAFSVHNAVWTQVSFFRFHAAYWKGLFPLLQDFYMNQYMWRAILKRRGVIPPGCIDPCSLTTSTIRYRGVGAGTESARGDDDGGDGSARGGRTRGFLTGGHEATRMQGTGGGGGEGRRGGTRAGEGAGTHETEKGWEPLRSRGGDIVRLGGRKTHPANGRCPDAGLATAATASGEAGSDERQGRDRGTLVVESCGRCGEGGDDEAERGKAGGKDEETSDIYRRRGCASEGSQGIGDTAHRWNKSVVVNDEVYGDGVAGVRGFRQVNVVSEGGRSGSILVLPANRARAVMFGSKQAM